MKKVLIIIPAYNEEESIERTITSVRDFLNDADLAFQLDYLVINDGSRDRTAELTRHMNADMIDFYTNLGLSGGFMAGMKYANRHDYDCAIQFDADGQHLPEYIPAMVEAAESGVDIVIGSRFVTEKHRNSLREAGNVLISVAIKVMTGKTVKDPTSGMRLFSRRAIDYYVKNSNMTPEPETISYFIKKGFDVKEVQVKMQERVAGESYLTIRRSIQYMARVIISILILQPFRR